MRWVFAMLVSPVLLLLFALGGCATGKDPVVGTWKSDDVKMICRSDGTGVHRFDRDSYYAVNKTYEGVETKFQWKKTGPKTYAFYYEYPKGIFKKEGVIENGELVFDQGDYKNYYKK